MCGVSISRSGTARSAAAAVQGPTRLADLRRLGAAGVQLAPTRPFGRNAHRDGRPAGEGRQPAAQHASTSTSPRRSGAPPRRPRRHAGLPGTLRQVAATRRSSPRTRPAGASAAAIGCGRTPRRTRRSMRSVPAAGSTMPPPCSGPTRRNARRDGCQVYRCYKDSHQSCQSPSAAPRHCTEDHPWTVPGARIVNAVLHRLDVRRCQNGELTRRGLRAPRPTRGPARSADRRAAAVATPCAPGTWPTNSRPCLFLRDPSIDAHQLAPSEQAIRPDGHRKVCGGNRTRRGAEASRCCPVWYAPPANGTCAVR